MNSIRFVPLLVLLASCSPKIPFTQNIREQNKLTPEEIKGIQFYLSDAVTLRRGEEDNSKKSTEQGKLVIERGKSLDQISFRANTPGAVEGIVDQSTLKMAFEDGPENYLVFASARNRSGYYALQAFSWEAGRGKINYGGKTWFTNRGSDQAVLLFKMKSIKRIRVNDKVAKGKKVR
jgi:hypothetical protein